MYKYSTDVQKYDKTNAIQLITLPNIATSLNPYLFANVETKGPEKNNMNSQSYLNNSGKIKRLVCYFIKLFCYF